MPPSNSLIQADAARAQHLDHQVRLSLANSLDYLRQERAAIFEHSAPNGEWQRLIAGLKQGETYSPAVFGWYGELVLALFDDDISASKLCAKHLVAQAKITAADRLVPLDAFADPTQALLCRQMSSGVDGVSPFIAPEPLRVASFKQEYQQALDLLKQADPEQAEEIMQIVSQVIFVADDPETDLTFDGGSCYLLWGGLFLNVRLARNRFELAEVLVHEASHLLLYGLCNEERLLDNDPSERYPSPLRAEPRPLDGIFHATFVLARMHRALQHMTQLSQLLPAERQQLANNIQQRHQELEAGWQTLSKHAQFTPTGSMLYQHITDYLQSL